MISPGKALSKSLIALSESSLVNGISDAAYVGTHNRGVSGLMSAGRFFNKHITPGRVATVGATIGGAYLAEKAFLGPAYESMVNETFLGAPHATKSLAQSATAGAIQYGLGGSQNVPVQQAYSNVPAPSSGGYNFAPSGDVVLGMWNLR